MLNIADFDFEFVILMLGQFFLGLHSQYVSKSKPDLSFQLRGIVSAICIALTAVADAVQTTTYQPVTNTIGHQGIFLIFTVVCFFATTFTFFFVPETKDKSVEKIYQIMNGENKKERKLEIEMASA